MNTIFKYDSCWFVPSTKKSIKKTKKQMNFVKSEKREYLQRPVWKKHAMSLLWSDGWLTVFLSEQLYIGYTDKGGNYDWKMLINRIIKKGVFSSNPIIHKAHTPTWIRNTCHPSCCSYWLDLLDWQVVLSSTVYKHWLEWNVVDAILCGPVQRSLSVLL